MKTKAIKITCKNNPEAICVFNHLEADGIIPDIREGGVIHISIEATLRDTDSPFVDEEHLGERVREVVEDACMEYEINGMPEIEECEYDFDGIENHRGGPLDDINFD